MTVKHDSGQTISVKKETIKKPELSTESSSSSSRNDSNTRKTSTCKAVKENDMLLYCELKQIDEPS